MRPLAPETLFTEEEIRAKVLAMARAIERDTPEEGELAALVVLKGAFVFAADLLREIPRRVRVGFLEIHKDPSVPGHADFVFTHPFPIEGSDLLLVEDILDTGITLRYLLSRLRSRRPARLRTAVLLDKKARRQVDVPVEYVGFEAPDRWIVGYGLDDDEAYRNLREIGYVDEGDRAGQ